MKFEEVMKMTEARGATLPSDMLEAAKSVGIRKLLLLRYLDLQVMLVKICYFVEKKKILLLLHCEINIETT